MDFKFRIIGTVGRDAESKQVNGQTVTTFSVATKPKKDLTVWVKVTTWGKRAENDAQYVKKGMLVFVEGIPDFDAESGKPRIYTAKDGTVRSSGFEMTGNDVKYLSRVTHSDDTPTVQSDIDVDSILKDLNITTESQIPF